MGLLCLPVVKVTDAIFYDDKGGKAAGQAPRFHYAIAQCMARVTDAAAAQRVTAGDDAAAVGWYTLDEVVQVEKDQDYGTVASVFGLALALNKAGLVEFDK